MLEMKMSRDMLRQVFSLILILYCSPAAATTWLERDMTSSYTDPLFNMPFDRQLHHFEVIDAGSLPSACAAFLRRPPQTHRMFLFGKYIDDKIKIYIVNDVRDMNLSVQRG
jgi:hypothetical protein